jgi:hypothetical protein
MLQLHRDMYALRAAGEEADPIPLLAARLLARRGGVLCQGATDRGFRGLT